VVLLRCRVTRPAPRLRRRMAGPLPAAEHLGHDERGGSVAHHIPEGGADQADIDRSAVFAGDLRGLLLRVGTGEAGTLPSMSDACQPSTRSAALFHMVMRSSASITQVAMGAMAMRPRGRPRRLRANCSAKMREMALPARTPKLRTPALRGDGMTLQADRPRSDWLPGCLGEGWALGRTPGSHWEAGFGSG